VGSDGIGAGVPTGVAGGSVRVTVTGTEAASGLPLAVGVAVGVAVGTLATLTSPAPERARGTVPSKRKSTAMIPRPQRA
jgi:hypothetical protein